MPAHQMSLVVASITFLVGCGERSALTAPGTMSFQAVQSASAPAPFSSGLVNPCNGEFVDVEGWIQLRFVTRTDANGGSHTVGRILEHGNGTGAVTGAAYVFSADSIITANAEAIQSGTAQIVVIRLLGQGQVPNFLGLQVLHFVVNPNGDLVGVVDDFRGECR